MRNKGGTITTTRNHLQAKAIQLRPDVLGYLHSQSTVLIVQENVMLTTLVKDQLHGGWHMAWGEGRAPYCA